MADYPQRINIDTELFGQTPLPAKPAVPATDLAEAALRIFRAAAIRPPYDVDHADMVELWGVRLAAYDMEAVLEAANNVVSEPGAEFPSVADFEVVVQACQRDIRRRRQTVERNSQAPIDTVSCRVCDDVGFVNVGPADAVIRTLRPCHECRGAAHDTWKAGHYMVGHRCSDTCPGYQPPRVRSGRWGSRST